MAPPSRVHPGERTGICEGGPGILDTLSAKQSLPPRLFPLQCKQRPLSTGPFSGRGHISVTLDGGSEGGRGLRGQLQHSCRRTQELAATTSPPIPDGKPRIIMAIYNCSAIYQSQVELLL